MIYDLIIIGGGVSGVISAITYKNKNINKKVLIIERNKELLRKLAVTGNGKCNFTNGNIDPKIYNNGESFKDIINENTLSNILSFMDKMNIKYFKDEENRYYPLSKSAKSIKEILVSKLNKNEYILEEKIEHIKKENNVFILNSLNNEYKSKNLIISTGAINYSSLGCDLNLKEEIIKFGHKFTLMYPSDIYIKVKEKEITKKLTGLRFDAKISLFNNDKLVYFESGELLFKDDALSGIVVFNVSSRLANLYKLKIVNNPYIKVDFLETINSNELNYLFNGNLKNNLLGLFNDKLVEILMNTKKEALIENIKGFRFNIVSLGDFEHAQVTCGGIDTKDIKSNLESKLVNNLYFLGDILDIDAPCGGYNLSFAINSALKVGEEIE